MEDNLEPDNYWTPVRSQSAMADALCGIKKSERSDRIRRGEFITPFSLGGGRAKAFFAGELQEYPAAYANGASNEEIRKIVARQLERRKTRLAQFRAS